MVAILEGIMALSYLVILFSSFAYRRQLKLTKWKRKLSFGEMTMYIALTIAIPVYGILCFVLLFGT